MDPSQQPSFQPSDQPSQFPSFDPSDELTSHNPTASVKPSASASRAPVGPALLQYLRQYPRQHQLQAVTIFPHSNLSRSTTIPQPWILKHTEATTDNIHKTK